MNSTYEHVTRWARGNPERSCVLEGDWDFTFARLLEHVEVSRRDLERAGVGPGDLVAVSRGRRGPAIAGMLAAWAVGAAYLPLAHAVPKARTELILDTARPAAVLTDGGDARAPAECVVRADGLRRLDPAAAYVIFTSGSTGRPKGVIVGHSGLEPLTRWHPRMTRLSPGECAGQVAEVTFDASVLEIWGALANGVSLAVPSLDDLLEPAEFQRFLLTRRVRASFVPTGLVSPLLDLDWPRDFPLRVLFTGGDRLTRWPAPRHPFELVNVYGPAECTVAATSYLLTPRTEGAEPPAIGAPLSYVGTRVVRPGGEPVATGETGELWLTGPALALGYLGDAAADAAFVRSDLGDGPRRWYRTGDLVTEGADGVLRYVSRMDDQVQIGGRRTEPAEIVHAILTVPDVTNAVVFTRKTPSGETRLAAAVTPATVTRNAIHRRLQQVLPQYMIPSDILALDSLPLTGHGKFDVAELRQAIVRR